MHDPRCDRFTTMMRRHTKTSWNTRETWENEYYVKTNSRTKTSLGKTRLSSLAKSPDGAHWLMRVLMQHHHKQRESHDDNSRRIDEPVEQISKTGNNTVDVPLPKAPTKVARTIRVGSLKKLWWGRQVRQRKEVKMSQLSFVERRILEKHGCQSGEPSQKSGNQGAFSGRNNPSSNGLVGRAMDTRWDHTQLCGAKTRLTLIQILEIKSHSPTLAVCNHGHKLQLWICNKH